MLILNLPQMKLKTGNRVQVKFLGEIHYGEIIEHTQGTYKVKLDKGTILPLVRTEKDREKDSFWWIVKKV